MIVSTEKISNRHWKLKEKALQLRRNGLSYREILKTVPVAKSTISLWCRAIPLLEAQKLRLKSRRGESSMKGIRAIQRMFWSKRCHEFYRGIEMMKNAKNQKHCIAGLMLYWAEGTKQNHVTMTNSDPRVMKFMASWFEDFLGVSPYYLAADLHLHSGQDEIAMKKYWSDITGIPIKNFRKSFVKPEGSGYRKKVLYHGTLRMSVRGKGSTYALFRILGAIAQFLEESLGEKAEPHEWMQKLPYA